MPDHERVEVLLDRWEDVVAENPETDVESFLSDYCRGDAPEIVAIVRKRITVLRSMNRVLNPTDAKAEGGKRPTTTGEQIHLAQGSEPIAGYVLRRRIAAGGFGEVWEAAGPSEFPVAMKFVHLDAKGEIERKSLRIAKKARHPNLIVTHGAWQRPGWLITAMELADHSLFDRFGEAISEGLPGIPRKELLRYMLDVAAGIDFLNRPRDRSSGVQHRDIKPQNLLVIGGRVKVADFGIARVVHGAATGHTGHLSLSYAAPEFFDGRTSEHSDQYSLAVTYCHLLTGQLPFSGTDIEIMRGHVDRAPDLSHLSDSDRAVVARAMSKSPADRWPSCAAFVKALIESKPRALPPQKPRPRQHKKPVSPPPTRRPAQSTLPQIDTTVKSRLRAKRKLRSRLKLLVASLMLTAIAAIAITNWPWLSSLASSLHSGDENQSEIANHTPDGEESEVGASDPDAIKPQDETGDVDVIGSNVGANDPPEKPVDTTDVDTIDSSNVEDHTQPSASSPPEPRELAPSISSTSASEYDSLASFSPDLETEGLAGRTASDGNGFKDFSPDGAPMVGLRLTTGRFGAGYKLTAISSIQPIYLTGGKHQAGQVHGRKQSQPIEVIAKEGYAIAGLRIGAFTRLTYVQVIFMRIDETGLDTNDTYTSDWLKAADLSAPSKSNDGPQRPDEPIRIGGSGRPIIGIFGLWNQEMRAIGLIEKDEGEGRWRIADVH